MKITRRQYIFLKSCEDEHNIKSECILDLTKCEAIKIIDEIVENRMFENELAGIGFECEHENYGDRD